MDLWHESWERGIIIWIGIPDKSVKASPSFWFILPLTPPSPIHTAAVRASFYKQMRKYVVLPTWSPRLCGLRVRAAPARPLSTVGWSHTENVSTFPSQEAFAQVTYFTDTQKPLTAHDGSAFVRLAEVSMGSCFREESMLTAPFPQYPRQPWLLHPSLLWAACGCLGFHRCVCAWACVCVCVCTCAHATVHICEGCRRSTGGRETKDHNIAFPLCRRQEGTSLVV